MGQAAGIGAQGSASWDRGSVSCLQIAAEGLELVRR